MGNSKGLIRVVAEIMAAVMLWVSLPMAVAQADMISTDQVIDQMSVEADRERILDFMTRDDVRQQIEALGVDPDEAAARVNSLTDAEVQQIAGKLDELPAGEGAIAAIVGAIVIIFLVLLLTDLLGLTDVFPFVRSQR